MTDSESYWPVVVVGGGPAGALVARQAAMHGAKVLLVERAAFPRRKVCGCCLNARGRKALAEAGLGDLPEQLGARPLTSLEWCIGRRSTLLPMAGGVSLSREGLDLALLDAARAAGVTVLEKTTAEPAGISPTARRVQLRSDMGETSVEAGLVLACDGLASKFGEPNVQSDSRIGLGTVLDAENSFLAPGRLWMIAGQGGYVGLVRLEDDRLDIAAAADREAVRRAGTPGRFIVELLRSAGQPVPNGLEAASWQGTPTLTRRNPPAGDRLLRIGDAAGYVEPFTGEGMAWALSAAVAAGPLAAKEWAPGHVGDWNRWYGRHIAASQRGCRIAAKALRSPTVVTGLVRLSSLFPGVAVRVVRHLHPPGDFR